MYSYDGPYYNAQANFHEWKPGTANPPPEPRAYTNVGYGLLGYLVEKITNKELVRIKHALPVKEYRLLKNRKSARKCRRKKKQELEDTK